MSKKIGSKLAESLRQRRGNPAGETTRLQATQPLSPPAPNAPATPAQQRVQRAAQEPFASHGVLHPSRIWPD